MPAPLKKIFCSLKVASDTSRPEPQRTFAFAIPIGPSLDRAGWPLVWIRFELDKMSPYLPENCNHIFETASVTSGLFLGEACELDLTALCIRRIEALL